MILIILNSVHWAYWSCLWCLNNTFSLPHSSLLGHYSLVALASCWSSNMSISSSIRLCTVCSVKCPNSLPHCIHCTGLSHKKCPPGQPFTEEHCPSASEPILYFTEVSTSTVSLSVVSGPEVKNSLNILRKEFYNQVIHKTSILLPCGAIKSLLMYTLHHFQRAKHSFIQCIDAENSTQWWISLQAIRSTVMDSGFCSRNP